MCLHKWQESISEYVRVCVWSFDVLARGAKVMHHLYAVRPGFWSICRPPYTRGSERRSQPTRQSGWQPSRHCLSLIMKPMGVVALFWHAFVIFREFRTDWYDKQYRSACVAWLRHVAVQHVQQTHMLLIVVVVDRGCLLSTPSSLKVGVLWYSTTLRGIDMFALRSQRTSSAKSIR